MGKQRPRIAKRGSYSRAYTPAKTTQWEKDASKVFSARWMKPPIDQAVLVDFTAFRKRPKSMCTKSKVKNDLCTVKPDLDNICKIVLDALVKAGVLLDDNLVCDIVCRKRWAEPGQIGRVEVAIDLVPMLDK